jgi:quercetin dioxygenase-like cupin family protein
MAENIKPGEVLKLADVVSYQAGAVVSREIVSKNTEHTAPFDALVHVIDGEVEITIAGKPLKLAAGDMVVMPANKPHALKALARFKMVLTMLRA